MKYLDLLLDGGAFPLKLQKVIIQGPDAQSYLNNQTTNSISSNKAKIHCMLDLKGKIKSFFSLIKKDQNKFLIFLESEMLESFTERLEQFKVIEEFEIDSKEVSGFFVFGKRNEDHQGEKINLFGIEGVFTEEAKPTIQKIEIEEVKNLQGILGDELNKFFNETRYLDFSYDRSKGCFLGQEIVSKIDVHRKSSKFPVLLEDLNTSQLSIFLAPRADRIQGKEIEVNGSTKRVNIYPVFIKEDIDLAQDFYDSALKNVSEDGELSFSLELLNYSIEYNPGFLDALEMKGVILGRLNRYDEAIKVMKELSSLDEASVMAHTNLSLFYMKIGDIENAEIEKSNATLKSFKAMGVKADIDDQNEERKKMFNSVLEIDEFDEIANYGLGSIYLEAGDLELSEFHLKRVLEKNKKHSVSYLALAKVYKKMSKQVELKEILTKGIEVSSKNGDFQPANEMQSILIELNR